VLRQRLKARREVSQEGWWFFYNLDAPQFVFPLVHFQNRFDQVIDVVLRIDPARYRQSQKLAAHFFSDLRLSLQISN
jgi:hypothetical protein